MTPAPSPAEWLAVVASRQLSDDTTVFAGVGVPLLAAALAQATHAPDLTIVVEGGIVGPRIKPGRLPISTNEMRAAYQAAMLPGITDTFLLAQRGFLDYGFMGGAQIDQHGNINTSILGPDYWRPKVRLPGTGSLDPSAGDPGTLLVADVGELSWEELDVVFAGGANLGWPLYEGLGPYGPAWEVPVYNQDEPNPLFGTPGCDQPWLAFQDLIGPDALVPAPLDNPCAPGVPRLRAVSVKAAASIQFPRSRRRMFGLPFSQRTFARNVTVVPDASTGAAKPADVVPGGTVIDGGSGITAGFDEVSVTTVSVGSDCANEREKFTAAPTMGLFWIWK